MIGFSASIGTNMLPGEATSSAAASPTNREPIPTSLPSRSIRAAPAKAGCGGVVNRASGRRYSQ